MVFIFELLSLPLIATVFCCGCIFVPSIIWFCLCFNVFFCVIFNVSVQSPFYIVWLYFFRWQGSGFTHLLKTVFILISTYIYLYLLIYQSYRKTHATKDGGFELPLAVAQSLESSW